MNTETEKLILLELGRLLKNDRMKLVDSIKDIPTGISLYENSAVSIDHYGFNGLQRLLHNLGDISDPQLDR